MPTNAFSVGTMQALDAELNLGKKGNWKGYIFLQLSKHWFVGFIMPKENA